MRKAYAKLVLLRKRKYRENTGNRIKFYSTGAEILKEEEKQFLPL
jgi:hypothetical protein